MAIEVTPPFKEFTDINGAPLDNGYIYIGTENLNPEVNLINIYWDSTFTTPAANPVRTIAGYPSRNGSPARIFTKSAFSITVKDKNSQLVYTSLSNNEVIQAATVGTIAALRTTIYTGQPFVSVTGYYTPLDNIGVREYTWDATSTTADNGGSVIQVTEVVTGRWKLKTNGTISILDFGATTSSLDNSPYFALAYGNTTFNNVTVTIPKGEFTIKAPIVIPCGGSLIGEGAGSIIKADFSGWIGTDYRAIIIKSKEGINYNGRDYNAQIRDFSLFGLNNSTLVSIGIDFRAAATIDVGVAVNYSWYNGIFTDVLISGFDTGINIFEMWNSVIRNINVMYCRASLVVNGKAVNITFDRIALTNHTNANTSSIAATSGMSITQSTRYNGAVVGRPEGLVVTPGSLIFGAETNLNIGQCLYFRISESIIDGATGNCISIGSPDNVSILNNYIYSSGAAASGIYLAAVASSDSKINIIGNQFVGNFGTSVGINLYDTVRKGITISDNFFRLFQRPIKINYLSRSKIIGNYGIGNSSEFMYITNGGENLVIDENVSDDNLSIILLGPSAITTIDIRNNKSALSNTYFMGKVTMLTGATTITLPSNFHTALSNYVFSITTASPNKNIGAFWVTNNNSTTPSATLTTAAAIAADTVIYYTAKATPLTGL